MRGKIAHCRGRLLPRVGLFRVQGSRSRPASLRARRIWTRGEENMNTKSIIVGVGPLPEAECALLRARVAERGELTIMSELGLSRTSVARAAAGFALHPGTRRVI